MLLQTYVKVTLLLADAGDAVRQRARTGRRDETGLATLEWVALAIVAVGLATTAGVLITAVLKRKVDEIP